MFFTAMIPAKPSPKKTSSKAKRKPSSRKVAIVSCSWRLRVAATGPRTVRVQPGSSAFATVVRRLKRLIGGGARLRHARRLPDQFRSGVVIHRFIVTFSSNAHEHHGHCTIKVYQG